jgi:hypothetical protein
MRNCASQHPRDDYKELLELTIIFLGGVPPKGIAFRYPGAFHHARWMSKVLYCYKIWLFRQSFRLTKKEETGLRELCMFAAIVYVMPWMTSPLPAEAPHRDLSLMKQLHDYKAINPAVSKAVVHKFQSHMWYLSPELAALAFFDKAVSTSTKCNMVAALTEQSEDHVVQHKLVEVANLTERTLEDFVSAKSMGFFDKLGISTDFLSTDPAEWEHDDDFVKAEQTVLSLKVVNDHAERGVALVQGYNKLLTKTEEQFQLLLQVVSDHRVRYPDCRKRTLTKNN